MSEEIDKYLFQRLNYVVDKPEQMLLTNLWDLQKLFGEMKDLLGTSPPNEKIISEADWPKVRRGKLYYVNNLLTEWQAITKTLGLVHTPNSISAAYHLSKKLNKLKRDLKGGDDTESTHATQIIETNDQESSPKKIPQNYRWSSRFVDPKKVHGLDAKAMSLERELIGSGNSFKAIGIVGMPGIGKTTLAQLIFNESKVKVYFLPRIWVSMSKQPNQENNYDVKEIVERILRSLGVEEETIVLTFKQSKLEGLIFTLRMQLMDKRYLIVLDDVEKDFGKLNSGLLVKNGEMMKKLEYGLPKGFGGTVIVTSRDEKVVERMIGEENMHKMVPLSDPNSCWLIFKDWVKKDLKEFPSNLEGFEDEIIRKCGGLPLSAKLMGQIVNQRLKARRTANQLAAQQQQQVENQNPVVEQPSTQTENQNPVVEQPSIQTENQVTAEQPVKLQLIEMENREVQPENEQTAEETQQMENRELTEQLEKPQLTESQPPQPIENQQPAETENQKLTEQAEKPELTELKTESQQPQPENEEPEPIEKLKIESQELTEQPEKPQLTETETENQQPQPIENLQMENQQLAEMENQKLTEQAEKPELKTENQQPQPENEEPGLIEKLKMENRELTDQPEKPQLAETETENQRPQPIQNLQLAETENERLSEQTEKPELTELNMENQQPQPENEEPEPIEKLKMENKELTETENEELTKQTENEPLTEMETEDQLPLPENKQAAEDQQPQTETELIEQSVKPQLTEMENWELIEKPEKDNQQIKE